MAELLWTIVTFCFASVRSVRQVFALRFLLGLLESPFAVGVLTIMGSWYTSRGNNCQCNQETITNIFKNFLNVYQSSIRPATLLVCLVDIFKLLSIKASTRRAVYLVGAGFSYSAASSPYGHHFGASSPCRTTRSSRRLDGCGKGSKRSIYAAWRR